MILLISLGIFRIEFSVSWLRLLLIFLYRNIDLDLVIDRRMGVLVRAPILLAVIG